jgi:hypothetical protein
MTQAYSDPKLETDPHTLPDLELFELTATEVAERDNELIYEYMKRREFRFAAMNSRDRERMLDAIIKEEGITGGWFYWYCFPGCLPDSEALGPFATRAEALADAREWAADYMAN